MTKNIGESRTGHEEPGAIEPWQQALLPADANLRQAIRSLDESALQIAMVISPNGH